MRICYIAILLYCASNIFASAEVEIPTEYHVITSEYVVSKKGTILGLKVEIPFTSDYSKVEIYKSPVYSLLIDELIVDKKKIKPKIDRFTSIDDSISTVELENIDNSNLTITMRWLVRIPEDGFYYLSWPLNKDKSPKRYHIQQNSKEIYLKYRILFPNGLISQANTVKWEMELKH